MIFSRYDCVVVDGRIGRIYKRIYKGGTKRSYVVQFGAGGPFEEWTEDHIRPASKHEEDRLEGVRE